MIAQEYKKMLGAKSVIREMFTYGTERAKEIGKENVFDYSLGNPSVPVPEKFTKKMIELLETESPVALHGYSPSLGIDSVREAVAVSLEKRFGLPYKKEHIFMCSGAAAALAHAFRAVTVPGDSILTFAPFFPEYNPYVNLTGAKLKVVPPDLKGFQIDFEKFETMLTNDVTAVLINTPNNPSGIVYTTDTVRELARIMEKKAAEYGHEIYLISDEPYRELAYDKTEVPYLTKYYDNTVVGYSFSKSLSLPGERIGYLVIPDEAADSEMLIRAANVATRILGFVNAPTLQQKLVKYCLEEKTDISYYDRNREVLYQGLRNLGFSCIKPEGAFYLFMKSPVADEKQFCEAAKKYHILIVPGSSFACPGYVRLAYCVSYETIINSLPEFAKLAAEYKEGKDESGNFR